MTVGQELENVRIVLAALVGRRMVGPLTEDEEARYRLLCRREVELLRANVGRSRRRRITHPLPAGALE